jgi:hypothetical protein
LKHTKTGHSCICPSQGSSHAVWGQMGDNQDTGRKSANWRPSCMHWINLSEKPGMNFLRFCSPTHPASTEKVSRGYKRQVLRGDTANNFSQFVSVLGVVGNKSTHAEDTQQSLAVCADGFWLITKRHNSLDKSRPEYDTPKNSKTIYPSVSVRHTPRERPHTRCNPTRNTTRQQNQQHCRVCRVSGLVWA